MRALAAVAAAAVSVALALAAPAFASEQHPTQSELEAALVCQTCHLPLDESSSPFAQQMKGIIRAEIKAGWTRSRIENGFVAQYGKAILAEPQTHGFDLLAWVLPLGGIALGAAALGGGAWWWSRGRLGNRLVQAEVGPPLDPELERRVDEELARFDG